MIARPETGWNLLLVVSLAAICAGGWYGFFMPTKEDQGSDLVQINSLVAKAKDRTQSAQKAIQDQTWNLGLETLAATALNTLSDLAIKDKVQLSSFRSEKSGSVAGLTTAPFVAVVDGAFPDVVAFAADLEKPTSRLAVEMLQITTSDAVPGQVTATLGLEGYTVRGAAVPTASPPPPVSASAGKTRSRATKGKK